MSPVVPESYHCRPKKSNLRMKINVWQLSSFPPPPIINIIQLFENAVGQKNHGRAKSRLPNPITKDLKLRAHINSPESTMRLLFNIKPSINSLIYPYKT